MRHTTAALGAFVLVTLGGCSGGDKAGGASGATSTATSAAPAPPKEPEVAGTYRAAWGDTVFVQTGSAVTATYPGGSLQCTRAGDVLDCSWKEGSASGKALLQRQPDGSIKGNWGNGASPTDGGQWTFSPKK
jgi:hypothetical protein